MKLLDSAMKESQRLKPITLCKYQIYCFTTDDRTESWTNTDFTNRQVPCDV